MSGVLQLTEPALHAAALGGSILRHFFVFLIMHFCQPKHYDSEPAQMLQISCTGYFEAQQVVKTIRTACYLTSYIPPSLHATPLFLRIFGVLHIEGFAPLAA